MKKLPHPFLELPTTDSSETFSKRISQSINLPERNFPPRFSLRGKDYFCGGYFVGYSKRVSATEIAQICKNKQWSVFASLVADFLIIYCDYKTCTVYIITDGYGKFPWYFTIQNNRLIASTDFAAVISYIHTPHANMDVLIDVLVGFRFVVSDTTIIHEIHQLPPTTLLVVKKDLTWELQPITGFGDNFSEKLTQYVSNEQFLVDFLKGLNLSIQDRLQAIEGYKFTADLSSGFDSSLICYLLSKNTELPFSCYAMISRYRSQTDPQGVIAEFARKHALAVKFIITDRYYPFTTRHDLEWTRRYIGDALQESFYQFLLRKAQSGIVASFEGFGGDEIYKSYELELMVPFSVQYEYFFRTGLIGDGECS